MVQKGLSPITFAFRFILNSVNVTNYSIAYRPLFRSYKPADEGLQKASLPVAQPEAVDEQVAQELSSAAQAPALEEIVSKFFFACSLVFILCKISLHCSNDVLLFILMGNFYEWEHFKKRSLKS